MSFEHQLKIMGGDAEAVQRLQNVANIAIEKKHSDPAGELQKTELESSLIQHGIEAAKKFLGKKLGISRPPFPISRVVLIPPIGSQIESRANHLEQKIFLERSNLSLRLSLTAAHEWLHLASPMIIYLRQNKSLAPWRLGISATKHPQNVEDPKDFKEYEGLDKLHEAIVGRITHLLYFDSFIKDPRFRKEIQACQKIKDYIRPMLPFAKETIIEKEASGVNMSAPRIVTDNF